MAESRLLNAAESGNAIALKDAINKDKFGINTPDVNSPNKEDATTLHIAVSEGHYNVTQILLDNNVNVNARNNQNRTALHLATIRGRDDIVKLLLSKGADVNI